MTRLNWDDTKRPTTLNDHFDTVLMMMMMMTKCDIRQIKLPWSLQWRKKLGRLEVTTGWISTYSLTTKDINHSRRMTLKEYMAMLLSILKLASNFGIYEQPLWRLSLGRSSL